MLRLVLKKNEDKHLYRKEILLNKVFNIWYERIKEIINKELEFKGINEDKILKSIDRYNLKIDFNNLKVYFIKLILGYQF